MFTCSHVPVHVTRSSGLRSIVASHRTGFAVAVASPVAAVLVCSTSQPHCVPIRYAQLISETSEAASLVSSPSAARRVVRPSLTWHRQPDTSLSNDGGGARRRNGRSRLHQRPLITRPTSTASSAAPAAPSTAAPFIPRRPTTTTTPRWAPTPPTSTTTVNNNTLISHTTPTTPHNPHHSPTQTPPPPNPHSPTYPPATTKQKAAIVKSYAKTNKNTTRARAAAVHACVASSWS